MCGSVDTALRGSKGERRGPSHSLPPSLVGALPLLIARALKLRHHHPCRLPPCARPRCGRSGPRPAGRGRRRLGRLVSGSGHKQRAPARELADGQRPFPVSPRARRAGAVPLRACRAGAASVRAWTCPTQACTFSHTLPPPPFSFSLPCPPPLAETAEELLLRASSKGDRFDGRAFRRSLGKSGKYVRNPVNDEASLAQMEADGTGYSSTGLIAQVSVELRGGEARGRRPACHRLHPRLTPRGACLGDGQTA